MYAHMAIIVLDGLGPHSDLSVCVLASMWSGPCLTCDGGLQELGATFQVGDIPADLQDQATEWREKLLEQVAEMDDEVMEKYLDVSCLAGLWLLSLAKASLPM